MANRKTVKREGTLGFEWNEGSGAEPTFNDSWNWPSLGNGHIAPQSRHNFLSRSARDSGSHVVPQFSRNQDREALNAEHDHDAPGPSGPSPEKTGQD